MDGDGDGNRTNSAPRGEKIDPMGADGAEGEMVPGGRATASPLQSSSGGGGALWRRR